MWVWAAQEMITQHIVYFQAQIQVLGKRTQVSGNFIELIFSYRGQSKKIVLCIYGSFIDDNKSEERALTEKGWHGVVGQNETWENTAGYSLAVEQNLSQVYLLP